MTDAYELNRYATPATATGDAGLQLLNQLSREDLIRIIVDDAKNWLAHDGLWFQAVESRYGIEVAIEADIDAWRSFTVIEAKRIMERLALLPGGGIPALVEALQHRLYARLNLQDVIEQSEERVVFRMLDCGSSQPEREGDCRIFPAKRWESSNTRNSPEPSTPGSRRAA